MERAVEMDPKSPRYQGNLADAYRWAPGQAASAAKSYRQALQLAEQQLVLNPNDADLRATVAVYYAKLPDRERSLAEVARARRLAPMQPKVLFKSALVYELTGQRDPAINALDLALQAGYSIAEIRAEPELGELRKDARYERLEQAISRRGK